jgi:hypothetical protein
MPRSGVLGLRLRPVGLILVALGPRLGALEPRSALMESRLGLSGQDQCLWSKNWAKNMDSETMNVGTGAKIEASRVKMGNSGAKIGAL